MATICRSAGRGDFLWHRDADNPVAARWLVDNLDGAGWVPKDLSGWGAQLVLADDFGAELHRQECETLPDGKAVTVLAAADAAALGASRGSWRILLEAPDGGSELMAWGYFEMEGGAA